LRAGRGDLASELIHAARVLADLECLPATDGNLSARLDAKRVLITRSGIEKRDLGESGLVEMSLDDAVSPDASSEWPLHRTLYVNRPEIGSVLHVHAPHLTAFSAVHRVPSLKLLSEALMAVGEIVCVPFCLPGTEELGTATVTAGPRASVYLLANHGAVAVGNDVRETLHRLERAEFLARVEWLCASLGGGVPIPDDAISALVARSPKQGGTTTP